MKSCLEVNFQDLKKGTMFVHEDAEPDDVKRPVTFLNSMTY